MTEADRAAIYVEHLRASHDRLLAAAKEMLSAYNLGVVSPYKMKDAAKHLLAAVAHAEERAP
jgi:hypothetical protein